MTEQHTSKDKKVKIVDYFFLEHGLTMLQLDTKQHWGPFVETLKGQLETNYIIKYCNCNSSKSGTQDGVELGALRLANEICIDVKQTLEKVKADSYRLHFIGHSLGGLYFRIAFGIMHRRGFFNDPRLVPFNFITLESPHCGVRKPNDNGSFDTLYKNITGIVFSGQTILDLTLNDRPFPPYDPTCLNEYPLLLRIVEDEYIDYLAKFKHLTLVQNIRFSYQVPYVSAAIDRGIPYDRAYMKENFVMEGFNFTSEYREIIDGCTKEYELQEVKGDIFEERIDGCVVHERIVSQLNKLPWRRINVHFRTKSSDVHLFIMGNMLRTKLFKNWRNEDTDKYLFDLCRIIKKDIEIANNLANPTDDIVFGESTQEKPKEEVEKPQTEETMFEIPGNTTINTNPSQYTDGAPIDLL